MPTVKPSGPKCPRCKKDMEPVPDEDGIHCPTCDALGLTNVYKRGNQIVGRP